MLGVTYLRRHKGVCHLKELPEKERHTLACKRGIAPDIRGERLVATKGVDIEMAPLDEDHVRAKITWSEQDVGGGKLVERRHFDVHAFCHQSLSSDVRSYTT